VEALSDFWTSCAQIRSQFTFLAIKYPLNIQATPNSGAANPTAFKAVASILFEKQKAKATVTFVFSNDLLARWPFAIRTLNCEVNVVYCMVLSTPMYCVPP